MAFMAFISGMAFMADMVFLGEPAPPRKLSSPSDGIAKQNGTVLV
jgi:hypothetical protein